LKFLKKSVDESIVRTAVKFKLPIIYAQFTSEKKMKKVITAIL